MQRHLANHQYNFHITGSAHSIGNKYLTNEQLSKRHDIRIRESFIDKRGGIRTRYCLPDEKTISDLATEAPRKAVEKSKTSLQRLRPLDRHNLYPKLSSTLQSLHQALRGLAQSNLCDA